MPYWIPIGSALHAEPAGLRPISAASARDPASGRIGSRNGGVVGDDGDLDVDNCESLETTAIDQRAMTRVVKVRKRGRKRLRVTLACPRRSRVRCRGRAAMARTPGGKPGKATRYRIRKGRRKTITVRRTARKRRWLVLREKDQRGRVRRLVKRVR